MAALSRSEWLRKLVHLGVGLIAFALRALGPALSTLCALLAVLHNAFLLPRYGGRQLWRGEDSARGYALGIVLYPVSVLLLLLAFGWTRLEVVAATWGILAFGDGMAGIVGMTLGRTKLPWNRAKSWLGSLAYWLCGSGAALVLLRWTAPGRYELGFAVAICAAAALFAALLESLPQGLDDNLGVPLVAGLVLWCLVQSAGGWSALATPEVATRATLGLAVNLVLGVAAYLLGGVGGSGFAIGVVLGTTLWTCLDWRGFALLFAFYALGTAATRFGYARKAAARLAEARGGRRGARNALAKTGVATLAALFAATTPTPRLFVLACAGAFAAAAFDTVSSEIGQLWGRRTVVLTSLRAVAPGTEGAVSLEGSLAGLAAALVVAATGQATRLLSPGEAGLVVVAAIVGNLLESLLGSTLERRGVLDKEAVNFLNTLTGALAAAALGALL